MEKSLFKVNMPTNTKGDQESLKLGDYVQTRNTKYEGKTTAIRIRSANEGYGRESPQLAELHAAAKADPPLFDIVDSSSDIESYENEEQLQCVGMMIALLSTGVVSPSDLIEVVADTVRNNETALAAAIKNKQYDYVKEQCCMLSEDTASKLAHAVSRMAAACDRRRRRSTTKTSRNPTQPHCLGTQCLHPDCPQNRLSDLFGKLYLQPRILPHSQPHAFGLQ